MLNLNCNININFNLLNDHPNDLNSLKIECSVKQFDITEKNKLVFHKFFTIDFNELEFAIENESFNSFINKKIDENFDTNKINELSQCDFIQNFKRKIETFIYLEGII